MKHILSPIAGIAVLAAILSCSEERIGSNPDGMVHGITVTGTDFVQDQADTRAAYTVDNSGFHFTWTAGDTVGIYPVGADQVAFPISSGDGSKTAQFDGGAWALRADRQYAAYYPYDLWNSHKDQTKLPVSYIGQTQDGNASTAHLDRYDYMASAAVKPDQSGCVNITMKHLGSFVRFQLTMPQTDNYTRLTLTDSGIGFVTIGTYDLSSQTPAIKSAGTSKTISMDLKNVSTTSAGQTITLYMMLAPCNMSGHDISLTLLGETGITYNAELDGKDFQPGRAYSYSLTITSGTNIKGDDFNWDYDEPSQQTHEYVDLGLSVKWATCNVGATRPEEYGDYYAWGETEPYYNGNAQNPNSWKPGKSDGYDWSSYKYCKGNYRTITKYCNNSSYGYSGYTDLKTVLDPEDDAAHVNWGAGWRMPTKEELVELRDNCTWTWYEHGNSEFDGIAGYKIISKKIGFEGNWIFLPAAGCREDIYIYDDIVWYWSSSLANYSSEEAYMLFYDMSDEEAEAITRTIGLSVRPVCQTNEYFPVSGITLDYNSRFLSEGEHTQLIATVTPSNATFKTVNWKSSYPSIATVDANGNVTAVSYGSVIITATTSDGEYSDSCIVNVALTPTGYENGIAFVDLGLSVKWATCNLGASKPEKYGDYFAWGETEPDYNGDSQNPTSWKSGKSSGYGWSSYKYCKGNYNTMTKYCSDSYYGYNGYTDSKTVLDPEDDAAHVNWGGNWRIPTYGELYELSNTRNCTWTWYGKGNLKFGGIAGYKVTSKKSGYTGNWIFLPAAGWRSGTSLHDVGSDGDYWSSSLYTNSPERAYHISFFSIDFLTGSCSRNYGHSVRPVCH